MAHPHRNSFETGSFDATYVFLRIDTFTYLYRRRQGSFWPHLRDEAVSTQIES